MANGPHPKIAGAASGENAQVMAAHESPRTTKLYDRTGDEITLDEVERINIRNRAVHPFLIGSADAVRFCNSARRLPT
jgi:hypothetical protein